jgi:luciferase-like monooxygenase
VVGVGLGAEGDMVPFGEGSPPAERAARLDEGLELLVSLWCGQPVSHEGEHSRLRDALLRPAPLQRPRIPIWVAGFWPNRAPFRRAARWDGALPLARGHLLKELSPGELRRCRDYVGAQRTSSDPFDLVAFAAGQPRTPEVVAEYEEAGATWWVEAVDPLTESLADFRARIGRGPTVQVEFPSAAEAKSFRERLNDSGSMGNLNVLAPPVVVEEEETVAY